MGEFIICCTCIALGIALTLLAPILATEAAAAPKAPSKPKEAEPEPEEEDDMEFANGIASYNVLAWELERLAERVKEIEAKGQPVPFAVGSRQQALEFRRDMLQIQVDTGQLDMEGYLRQLRAAVDTERAKSRALKAQPGCARKALDAFKRAKIMQEELDGALAEQAEE